MSIRRNPKRKKNPWECRWVEEGKHYSRSFPTRKEAEKFDVDRRSAANKGGARRTADEALTVDDYAKKFLDRNKRKSTRMTNRGAYVHHIKPRFGNVRIHRVRHSDIQALVDEWAKKGLKPRTIDRYLDVFRGILLIAKHDRVIDHLPTDAIDIPEPGKAHFYAMNPNEVNGVLDVIHPNYRAFFYTLVETGMRVGEAIALNIADFSWQTGHLIIRSSKTTAGIREIQISSRTLQLISEHISTTGRTMADATEPLFVSHRQNRDGLVTGTRIDLSNFRARIFAPAVAKAGLPHLQIHDTRRTSATTLVAQNTNLKAIQERMGHASIRTTLELYAKTPKEIHEDIAKMLGTIFAPQPETPSVSESGA